MPVQLRVQLHIQCSGHPCIQGQRQQEEVVHQMGRRTKEAEAAVKVMRIKAVNVADHHQEELDQEEAQDQEELDEEEARDQEQQDHLHQEEDMEEAAQRRGAPHRSQQEEQAIHNLLHLPLQDFHSLHVSQIHGVH